MATRLITPGELLQAPTGVDWNTLAEDAGVTDPRQALEQGFLIDSISSWAGEYCGQPLGLHATTQIEQARAQRSAMFPARCLIDTDGHIHFWAQTLPVLSVSSAQWSYLLAPLSWQAIVPGNVLPNQSGGNWALWGAYPQQRELEIFDQDYTTLKHRNALVQVTYTSGWPNAVITGTTALTAGSGVSIPVDSTVGMTATSGLIGNLLYIFDPTAGSEWVTVQSVADATHVVVATLANNHTPSPTNVIGISALPSEVKLAAIWACAAIARVRGAQAYEMKSGGVGEVAKHGGEAELMSLAEYLLNPYRVEF